MSKLTKKQKQKISKMYAGSILTMTDCGFVPEFICDSDHGDIAELVRKIGYKIQGELPDLNHFNAICEYVINEHKQKISE